MLGVANAGIAVATPRAMKAKWCWSATRSMLCGWTRGGWALSSG